MATLPLVPGATVLGRLRLRPDGFPGECHVFSIDDELDAVADVVRAMQADNQPHNLVLASGHVYVFPKPLVRPARSFELYPETVGGPELAGSFTVYREDDYEALSWAAADELFRLNTAPLPSRLLHRGSPPLAATAARTDDTAVGCGNSGAATATYAGALSARLLPMKACQSMDTLPSAMPGCLVYC